MEKDSTPDLGPMQMIEYKYCLINNIHLLLEIIL